MNISVVAANEAVYILPVVSFKILIAILGNKVQKLVKSLKVGTMILNYTRVITTHLDAAALIGLSAKTLIGEVGIQSDFWSKV